MNKIHIYSSATNAFFAALLVVVLGTLSFFAFEPSIGHSQEVFTVSQTITDQVSFLVVPADVGMTGTIAGLTGGYATGTTMAVITTNDPQGYYMTLSFSDTTAMHLNGSPGTVINNYSPATPNVPDFNWVTNGSGGAAEFGYNVAASTSVELDPSFLNDTTDCNAGSNMTANKCWLNPSTTPERIVGSTGPVAFSTTTIKFKVAVPNNPSPVVPSGVYVATGTLTIAGNP
jgi:hypothetical protein